jgi:hypothetical protein
MDDQLTPSELDQFFRAYVECALWSSTDEEGEPLEGYELSVQCHNAMLMDCRQWADYNCEKLRQAIAAVDGYSFANAGHDYWLTRNHHGAGFWDRGLGDIGQYLTDMAHAAGSIDLYVSDAGEIEQSSY